METYDWCSTQCFDLVQIDWWKGAAEGRTDCAVVLEVWPTGGLLHVDNAIPEGTPGIISSVDSEILAVARASSHDQYGYYVEVAIDPPAGSEYTHLPVQGTLELSSVSA